MSFTYLYLKKKNGGFVQILFFCSIVDWSKMLIKRDRFGERDLSLVRLFWYRRFDNGMVAFLECLTELAAQIQMRDKNFRLPYKHVTF